MFIRSPYPSLFHSPHPIPLASFPRWSRMKYRDTFVRPKDLEYFQYPATAPAFPPLHPRPRTPIPFFRLRRPRVVPSAMRIQILSPCSIETSFVDVWTLRCDLYRTKTWRLINLTEINTSFLFQYEVERRKGYSSLIFTMRLYQRECDNLTENVNSA